MKDLDRKLDLWAAREPREPLVDSAQRALSEVMAQGDDRLRRSRVHRIGGWVAAGGVAALVAAVPLVLSPTTAFARAQKHLADFQTLGFELEFMSGNVLLMRGDVIMTPDGNYRHTWGDIVSVRNQALGRNLTLFSVPRMYLEQDAGETATVDRWIALIGSLRAYDGEAVKLPEVRTIQGRPATGWTLTVRDKSATLWADEDGMPLELDVQETDKGHVYYRFEYNPPITGETFDTSIPAGYRSAEPERAECERTGKPIWLAVNTAEYTDPVTGETKTQKYQVRFDCRKGDMSN
jgi:hypothetical protein